MKNGLPTTLVIFGATGDLMGKKIVPSLWHLFSKGTLPSGWNVFGLSRRALGDEEFRSLVKEFLHTYVPGPFAEKDEEAFLSLFSFAQVAFENDADFEALAAKLDKRDSERGHANRLLYMAVPPEAFPGIFSHSGFGTIVRHGEQSGAHTHVIIEKPFGTDAHSAAELERVLANRFTEEQLYRADHYLAKQMLRNIPHFRFGSDKPLLEHLWNKDHIANIHIRTWETLGLENRGAFYDPLGTLRDVGQNHLLEMLALLTMEEPKVRGDAASAREARAEVLSKLKPFTDEDIQKHTFRAQYEGYQSISGVAPHSQTETYYSLTAFLDSPRWEGVPITMEAGKRMAEWRTEIIITFKEPVDEVVIRMRPEEEMTVTLEGKTSRVALPEAETTQQYVAEYAKILLDATAGNRTIFVDTAEIKACWKFIDPIVAGWKKGLVPLAFYKPDTNDAAKEARGTLSA